MPDQTNTFHEICSKIKRHFWHLAGAIIAGFLLAYSLTTRIGLLFIIPLWLKLIVLVGLTLNLFMLWFYLSIKYFLALKKNRHWLWLLVTGAAMSALLFLLIPYQRVPFRTTHSLEIQALESDVTLKAIYSPDDNLMSRAAFTDSEGVTPVDEAGFHLASGAAIQYMGAHTGKLTLYFTNGSGPVQISWDGQEKTITPQAEQKRKLNTSGWRIESEPDNLIKVTLPGNRWGNPDRLWTILGGLLPICDFFTLTTLISGLGWILLAWQRKTLKGSFQWRLFWVWMDGLLCLGFANAMVQVGFPDFIPAWFLFFFTLSTLWLAFQQVKFLTDITFIQIKQFQIIKNILRKSGNFLNRINQKCWLFIAAVLIIAILSSIVQLHLTHPGIGISGDSVHYLEGAKNLAGGRGYVIEISERGPEPITGFEPVYSALLAAGILFGAEVHQFARLLNTVLIFLTIIMAGWLMFKTTNKVIPAFLGSIFILLSPLILNIYAWAMSEPVFIVFLLGTMISWSWHMEKPAIWRALLTGLIASLMINTRFAGIVFLATLVLITLLLEKSKFLLRLRNAFVMGLSGIIPYAAFFIRNLIVSTPSSGTGSASLGVFPQEYWETLGKEVSSWFKWQNYFNDPFQRYNALFVSLGVLVLFVILWLVFRKKISKKPRKDSIIILIISSIPLYLTAIILNTVFLTADPTPSGLIRYMIPLLVLLIILVTRLFSDFWSQPFLLQKLIIFFIVLTTLQIYITDATKIIHEQPVLYRNYTDRKDQCGEDVQQIIDEKPGTAYYTNNCEYFYFITGLKCRRLVHEESAYAPEGDIYQAVKGGALVSLSDGFGTNFPLAEAFIRQLEYHGSACYLNFYRWPNREK